MDRNCRWFNEWADDIVEDIQITTPSQNQFMSALMTLLRLN